MYVTSCKNMKLCLMTGLSISIYCIITITDLDSDSDSNNLFNINMYIDIVTVQQKEH